MPAGQPRPQNARLDFSLAAAGALTLVILLLVLGRGGWPGAVSGCIAARDCACEAVGNGLIRQPVNAASSLLFPLAGLVAIVIGSASASPERTRANTFAGCLIATGVGSVALHASITEWGGMLDVWGATAVPGFVIAHRLSRWSDKAFAVVLAATLTTTGFAAALFGPQNGNYTLLAAIAAAVVVETVFVLRNPGDARWLFAAAGLLTIGAVVWWLGSSERSWCRPESVWQIHALWHFLASAGLVALFLHLRSPVR